MGKQKKLSNEIEENIQNLAGDIYVQIEDKITALLTNFSETQEIDDALVENHPHFLQLNDTYQQFKHDVTVSNEQKDNKIATLAQREAELTLQLNQHEQAIENQEKLDTAKLTNTEQTLKETLAENTDLVTQVSSLTAESDEIKQARDKATKQLTLLTEHFDTLTSEHTVLVKNDKAKAATLSVQNQQLSELQLKNEQISSELEYLKSEQEKAQKTTLAELTLEQEQVFKLKESERHLEQHNLQLQKQVAELEAAQTHAALTYEELESSAAEITSRNIDLTEQVTKGSNDIEHLTLSLTEAQTSIENKEKDIAQLQQTLTERQTSFDEQSQALNTQSDQLTQENQQLNSRLNESEQQCEKLSDTCTQLQISLDEQLVLIDALQEKHQTALAEIKSLEANVETLTKTESALTATLQDEQSKMAENKQQLVEQRKQILELQGKIETLSNIEKSLIVKVEHFEETVKTNEDNLQKLQEDNDTLKEQHQHHVEQLHVNHEKIVADIEAELQLKTSSLMQEKSTARVTIDDLESKINEQSQLLKSENNKNQKLQADYRELNDENTRQDGVLKELKQQITELEAEIEKQKAIVVQNQVRVQESKGKQELEYNKARETIKYLRDENTELNRKLVQEVSELEDKLTEYRLRFEYAQKQLTKLTK